MPEPYGNRHEFSMWRFFPDLSWKGRTKDGNASGAQRRGAEDAALWQMLRKVDETAHDRLLGSVFTNNYTYKDSPELFAKVYEELLSALQNAKQKNTDERSKG